MFHRRPRDVDTTQMFLDFESDNMKNNFVYWHRKLMQLLKSKLIVSVAYLISIIVVYQYFQIKSETYMQHHVGDSLDTPQYFIPDLSKAVKEPVQIFDQFKYKADAILLPNAPFKHIKLYPDIRATQLVYLDAVRQKLAKTKDTSDNTPPVFDMHWIDWIDMSDLEPLIIEKPNCFVAGVLGSNVRTEWKDCIDANDKSADGLNFYFSNPAMEHESEYRLKMRAKTYLHTVAPIPKKIVFLAGELGFVVRTNARSGLKDNGMVQDFITSRLESHKDIMLTKEQIAAQPITAIAIMNMISNELGRDLRSFDSPAAPYADVETGDFDTLAKKIKKSKLASLAARAGRRSFHNALVKSDQGNFDAPYDWRFFQRTLTEHRHRVALHHTVRAWLSFCVNLGFTSWIDEDSLVGWSFNGMLLPWEKVVKFKLSSKGFLKLGTYNYSLIVDDPMEGYGSYLLELSPFFMERARLNDQMKSPDSADARFIDTRTGVYIELNGLMVSDATVPPDLVKEFGTKEGFVNSGDGKFYHLSDILPVKRTIFEGKVAEVPGNALKLISHSDIHTISTKEYDNYKYQDHLRLWITKSKCNYVPLEDILIYEKGGSSFIGACHDMNIWKEFNLTQAVSLFRTTEINAREQLSIGAGNQFGTFYPDHWLTDRIENLNKEFGYPLP